MNKVEYSVNGIYFSDYGVYISESDGLFDALKRKAVSTFDWAEYHGSAPDLSNPVFEQREITLSGFVVGENWLEMKSNFDYIVSEFHKEGTQRLLIEPFEMKELPYEVYMMSDVKLDKVFRKGQMVGLFSIKLIEPNPIKRVLVHSGGTLNLSYESSLETEIFYGNGTKDIVPGNCSISGKVLPDNSVIVIAGNIEQITNFNSNAALLWEKL